MASLLDLCRQCGLETPADYLQTSFGAVVSAAGQRKLDALAAQDPALRRQLFDASDEAIAALLAGDPKLPKR